MDSINFRLKHRFVLNNDFLSTASIVLLHAKGSGRRHGQPEGAEGVPHLRQDSLRQVHVEQTHEDPHR